MEKKCRFPRTYSHVPWYKEYHQPHSHEDLKVLQESGLAEPMLGFENSLQVISTLKAGNIYAAQKRVAYVTAQCGFEEHLYIHC